MSDFMWGCGGGWPRLELPWIVCLNHAWWYFKNIWTFTCLLLAKRCTSTWTFITYISNVVTSGEPESRVCSCTLLAHLQGLYLFSIQPLCLSVCSIVTDRHGSEHPRRGCGGAVLCPDSGDRGVGRPKVQEGWEEEPWKQDRGGAPRRQEYQLAGWNFHHDW